MRGDSVDEKEHTERVDVAAVSLLFFARLSPSLPPLI